MAKKLKIRDKIDLAVHLGCLAGDTSGSAYRTGLKIMETHGVPEKYQYLTPEHYAESSYDETWVNRLLLI